MRPLVSIILPCYNAAKYLEHSLDSIINQHYQNLDIICIDDGSSDETLGILRDYQLADTRIRVFRNRVNLGLIETLNIGLKEVKGEFFARMDADDFCMPDRIRMQVDFLLRHPQYDMVGTSHRFFINDLQALEHAPPLATDGGALPFVALLATPFAHGSILGRSSLVKKGIYFYDKDYPHSEDFELFSRLAWQEVRMANLPEPLYWLRQNPESVSVRFNHLQVRSHLRISRRNLEERLGIRDLGEDLLTIASNRIMKPVTFREVKDAFSFLNLLVESTRNKLSITGRSEKEIQDFLNLHRLNILIQSNKTGFKVRNFRNIPFFIRSFTLLRPSQSRHVFEKLTNFIVYRLLQ